MALGRTRSVALVGLQGHLVDVEADISPGLPAFTVVGLPDTSVAEARDRVRAAANNSGVPLPMHRITVNLSPASVPKAGTSFDLAVAVAVLAAAGRLPSEAVDGVVHLGELGLDGRVRGVPGVLPAVIAATRSGFTRCVVPADNAAEAALVPGVDLVPVRHLADLVAFLTGCAPRPAVPVAPTGPPARGDLPDLRDVAGQAVARSALELAAAGGHHAFLLGPPGCGKTMLASRLPGILPDLEDEHALEVTGVHSLAGALAPGAGLVRRPPFVAPHHTATPVSVVGGGSGVPRPGAASRAHRGVLFLDEAPEFGRAVLDSLRQPLESGELVIHRGRGTARFPARFQLVLAANPCPCGKASGKGLECTCSSVARRRYLTKLSGPLLDRVDIHLQLDQVDRRVIGAEGEEESSATVLARVVEARAAQRERWAGTPWVVNAEVPGHLLRRPPWRLPPAAVARLDRGLDLGVLTLRGYDRCLRLAWTAADLAGRSAPGAEDVALASMLRVPPGAVAA